ncbi:sialoadhesin-like [Xiphophorus maculatus]|uniref:Sialoadhesin-like n=1 Tax=Xiphophorus maculatus TaxID=8083 RepID=M4A363_XIPMA|nr:sialoadhesin-like [Xiphophorus maculatus]
MAQHQQSCCFLIILCVRGVLGGDWSVVLPSSPICAAVGSTVIFPCSYDYPLNSDEVQTDGQLSAQTGSSEKKVLSKMWCLGDSRCLTKSYVFHSEGILQDPSYQNRVKYLGQPGSKNCSLRISNLKESDSGTYVFYLITNHKTQKMPPQTGVQFLAAATCTAVAVMASPSRFVLEGTALNLACCNPAATSLSRFTWYSTKGARLEGAGPVWKTRKVTTAHSGSYYCQMQTGDEKQRSNVLEIDVQYSPRNIILSTWRAEKDHRVTLTCSSEANPLVLTYFWYQGAACLPAADVSFYRGRSTQATLTGRVPKLTSANITTEDDGEHCCVARNKHGFQKASLILPSFEVADSPERTILVTGLTIGVVLASAALAAFFMIRKKKKARRQPDSVADTVTVVLTVVLTGTTVTE